jgi:hypothetical protein
MTDRPDRLDRPDGPTPPTDPNTTSRDPERARRDDVAAGTGRPLQQPADHRVDPLFREGADAPDAADIEDPETQR